jgi:hypothetical protein
VESQCLVRRPNRPPTTCRRSVPRTRGSGSAAGDRARTPVSPTSAAATNRATWQPPQPQPHAAWPDDGWFLGVLDCGIQRRPDGFERAGTGWSAYG